MNSRRTPLVLVVDDDLTTNRMIQAILTRAGFDVAGAYDTAGAWAGIRERQPDLVLLDVNLPDGSGLDVCRQLQSESGMVRTPVLFISANEATADKVKGFQAGGVDYIPKPFAGEEVVARVSTHLRLKRAYETLAELQAERIQRLATAQETLMPQPDDMPEARFRTALSQILTAGGDFYDVIQVGHQIHDYIVADASGHDLAASFWTASLKALLSEYATPANSPRDILHAINGALCRILPAGVFFTLLCARLNRQTGSLVLANAGHPPALVIRAGLEPEVLRQEGDVLGAFPDVTFEVTEIKIRPRDRVLLYSDGLIEAGGCRESGLKRLTAACRQHQAQPLAEMIAAVKADMTRDIQLEDDILLLGVEV